MAAWRLRLSFGPSATATQLPELGMPTSVVSIMPAPFINDPYHWRFRAKQMRALANDAKGEQAKQAMLRIAQDYDFLALRAEQRSKGSTQST